MYQKRAKTVFLTILLAFSAIILRLFYWQIIKGDEFRKKAILQTYKLEKILPAKGTINSADGYPMALSQDIYQVSIYKPNLKTNIDNVIYQINQSIPNLIDSTHPTVKSFITNQNIKWVDLPTKISKDKVEKINLPGISFKKYQSRFYPENHLAKNILSGLENYYIKQLAGKTGFSLTAKDAVGNILLTKKSWNKLAVDGQNLHLYLNRGIQLQTEQLLSKGIRQFSADSGSIIIIDPQTGGILAMSSQGATDSAILNTPQNTTISNLFEPGSIFKPLVVSMALDISAIQPDYICTKCNQTITFGEYTIGNWDNQIHPDSTLNDIIKNSDNIGMSHIIARLRLDNFLKYYSELGLTQKTGIDLQGETKPVAKKYWSDVDLATASFGQGIAVTQIQMVQAFNTIANNGILVPPKLVKSITENNKTIKTGQQKIKRVFQESTIKEVKSILKFAVENGAISGLKPKQMEVCAKSGTAQVAVKGGYSESSGIASYIGFSPCQNPKFTMIVTINNPKTSSWGSSTAAPIWFDLASRIYNLL
ncbi:MAG: penicillin-binding protein 2 [Candidatus Shapirobacteria bacterium]|jgi:cell division protein FtsI/penicillin-binding protein 2